MLLPMIVTALAVQQAQDAWTLKPSFDTKSPKQAWSITVDAEVGGQQHHATFDFTRVAKSADAAKRIVTYNWEKLVVDEHDGEEQSGWDAVTGQRGEIMNIDKGDDEIRRMLSPLVFVYPEKAIAVGDKWTADIQPTGKTPKITYAYEVKSKDIAGGSDALVVSASYKEASPTPMTATGTWWVSKVGKVVKFEMKIKDWVVPMAGADSFDATLKGTAR